MRLNVEKANYKDLSSVLPSYRARLLALCDMNLLRGFDEADGVYLKLNTHITRGQAFALIDRFYSIREMQK